MVTDVGVLLAPPSTMEPSAVPPAVADFDSCPSFLAKGNFIGGAITGILDTPVEASDMSSVTERRQYEYAIRDNE